MFCFITLFAPFVSFSVAKKQNNENTQLNQKDKEYYVKKTVRNLNDSFFKKTNKLLKRVIDLELDINDKIDTTDYNNANNKKPDNNNIDNNHSRNNNNNTGNNHPRNNNNNIDNNNPRNNNNNPNTFFDGDNFIRLFGFNRTPSEVLRQNRDKYCDNYSDSINPNGRLSDSSTSEADIDVDNEDADDVNTNHILTNKKLNIDINEEVL